jgi:hypothetical protein
MRYCLIHRFGGNPKTGEPELQIVHKADTPSELVAHARHILSHIPIGPSALYVRYFAGPTATYDRDKTADTAENEEDFDARNAGVPVSHPAIDALGETISAAGELAAIFEASDNPTLARSDVDAIARKGEDAALRLIAATRRAGLTSDEILDAAIFDESILARLRAWSRRDARYGAAVAKALGNEMRAYYMGAIFEPQIENEADLGFRP